MWLKRNYLRNTRTEFWSHRTALFVSFNSIYVTVESTKCLRLRSAFVQIKFIPIASEFPFCHNECHVNRWKCVGECLQVNRSYFLRGLVPRVPRSGLTTDFQLTSYVWVRTRDFPVAYFSLSLSLWPPHPFDLFFVAPVRILDVRNLNSRESVFDRIANCLFSLLFSFDA